MTGSRFKCVLYFLASNDLELQPTECVFGSSMNAINGPIHSDTQKNMKTPINIFNTSQHSNLHSVYENGNIYQRFQPGRDKFGNESFLTVV